MNVFQGKTLQLQNTARIETECHSKYSAHTQTDSELTLWNPINQFYVYMINKKNECLSGENITTAKYCTADIICLYKRFA